MNTLKSSRVAALINRLFMQADASEAALRSSWAEVPEEESDRLISSKTEYLDLYSRMKDVPLAVSRETGTLLYLLTRATSAHAILEFGTSFGISTLHLAAGLRDNGGGRLITTEFEPSKVERAREHLTAAGLLDLVEIREGDALQTLAQDLPTTLDLVLLDGAKGLYADILDLIEGSLRPGTLVLADDAEMCPDYVRRVRGDDRNYMSLSVSGDVELSIRLS